MNRIVDAWNRSQRRRPVGPDSISIDGEERFFEEKKMADGVEFALTKQVFAKYVRMAKSLGLEKVREVRTITWEALKRLGVKRDLSKAVKGVPKGSDQLNVSNVILWLRSVPREGEDKYSKKAVRQVVALDATLHNRLVG